MANVHHVETRPSPFGYYATCTDCSAITERYYPTAREAYYALCDSIRAFSYGPVTFKN